jgi:CRP-like cAMP-binding protein
VNDLQRVLNGHGLSGVGGDWMAGATDGDREGRRVTYGSFVRLMSHTVKRAHAQGEYLFKQGDEVRGFNALWEAVSSHPIPSHPIASHPTPSHPIPSHPIPSHPISSHPIVQVRDFYCLLSGEVEVVRHSGRYSEQLLNTLRAGEHSGENLTTPGPFSSVLTIPGPRSYSRRRVLWRELVARGRQASIRIHPGSTQCPPPLPQHSVPSAH